MKLLPSEAEPSISPGAKLSITTSAERASASASSRPRGRVEVERQRALVEIVEPEEQAAIVMRQVMVERADAAPGVAGGRLDLDHVGAHVGEQSRAQMSAKGCEVEHPQPGESAGLAHGLSFGRRWARLRRLAQAFGLERAQVERRVDFLQHFAMRAGALAAADADGFEGVGIDRADAEHAGLGLSVLVDQLERDALLVEEVNFSKSHRDSGSDKYMGPLFGSQGIGQRMRNDRLRTRAGRRRKLIFIRKDAQSRLEVMDFIGH